jgi:hypothetical protein
MDETDRSYGRRARIIAIVLLIVAGGSAVAGTLEHGLAGALEGGTLLYIAAVLGAGIFTNRLETPPFQAAFGVGLGVYGAVVYLNGSGLLWLGIGLAGAGVAVYNGFQAVQAR